MGRGESAPHRNACHHRWLVPEPLLEPAQSVVELVEARVFFSAEDDELGLGAAFCVADLAERGRLGKAEPA